MKHDVKVGDYIEPEMAGYSLGRRTIVQVERLTPTGIPVVGGKMVRRYTVRTVDDFFALVRQRNQASAVGFLYAAVCRWQQALEHQRFMPDLIAASRAFLATVDPDATDLALLQVLRKLHQNGALADCYGIADAADAPLDAAVRAWAKAGYPGTKGTP